MEKYDFDKIVDRRGTDSVKWDGLKHYYGDENLEAFWVADMDFETPVFIREAIARRLAHPVYGYSMAPESYWNSIIYWENNLHRWEISRDSLTYVPGIVKGIGYAVLCFTQPGDAVVIQQPVYYPFRLVPEGLGREIVVNPLVRHESAFGADEAAYGMDFDGLETIFREKRPKMLILSNPQNPGGTAWSKDTLSSLADICAKYGVIVISDEIHADMPLFGNEIHSFATVGDTAAQNSICFAAPSKTFNMAGIVSSFAVVCNPELRKKYFDFLHAPEFDSPTFIATVATEAAFSPEGDVWRRQMLAYVEKNIAHLVGFLGSEVPQVKAVVPQASFLVWLDCSGLRLGHDELNRLFLNKARLALNDGEVFGKGGEGFMRLNVGCQASQLDKFCTRLRDAVRG